MNKTGMIWPFLLTATPFIVLITINAIKETRQNKAIGDRISLILRETALFIIKTSIYFIPLCIIYDYCNFTFDDGGFPLLFVFFILIHIPYLNIITKFGVMVWSAILFFSNSYPLSTSILFYISFVLWIVITIIRIISQFSKKDTIDETAVQRLMSEITPSIFNLVDIACDDLSDHIFYCRDVVKGDFYILSFWLCRYICTVGCNDLRKIDRITDSIKIKFETLAQRHSDISYFSNADMFSNRVRFYDKLYMSCKNRDDFFPLLMDKFPLLIQHDMVNVWYEPFYSESPLPLTGIDTMVDVQMVAGNYILSCLKTIKEGLK